MKSIILFNFVSVCQVWNTQLCQQISKNADAYSTVHQTVIYSLTKSARTRDYHMFLHLMSVWYKEKKHNIYRGLLHSCLRKYEYHITQYSLIRLPGFTHFFQPRTPPVSHFRISSTRISSSSVVFQGSAKDNIINTLPVRSCNSSLFSR
jgi:hypothetical protein